MGVNMPFSLGSHQEDVESRPASLDNGPPSARPLLPYRYEELCKEQDSTSEDSSQKLSPSRKKLNHSKKRWLSKSHLAMTSMINAILLLTLVVLSVIYYSSIEAAVTKILTIQALRRQQGVTVAPKLSNNIWKIENVSSIVVFGDSYSAEADFWVFMNHMNNHSTTDWKDRVNRDTACGGYVWPRWVAWYTGARSYNYAVGGAVCSQRETFQWGALGVEEQEMVSFLDDVVHTNDGTNPQLDISSDKTVYATFLGANDLGMGGYLTHNQAFGKTTTDFVECMFRTFDRIYSIGGRNFIILNVVPLDWTPAYNSIEQGGVKKTAYGRDKPEDNNTVAKQMNEIVRSVNYALKYQAAFETQVSKRYAGAKVAVLDVHRLFSDIIQDPGRYLNGTEPPNVTGSCYSCNTTGNGECARCKDADSYLWYDQLHPSEQASRLIAQEFRKTMDGTSEYAEYWESPAA